MKKLIYSQEDVDLMISIETQQYQEELEYQKELQDRIDKAIEYINKNAFDVVNSEHKSIINVEELLNILKGDNK